MKLNYIEFPEEISLKYDNNVIGEIKFNTESEKEKILLSVEILSTLVNQLSENLAQRELTLSQIIDLATNDLE